MVLGIRGRERGGNWRKVREELEKGVLTSEGGVAERKEGEEKG